MKMTIATCEFDICDEVAPPSISVREIVVPLGPKYPEYLRQERFEGRRMVRLEADSDNFGAFLSWMHVFRELKEELWWETHSFWITFFDYKEDFSAISQLPVEMYHGVRETLNAFVFESYRREHEGMDMFNVLWREVWKAQFSSVLKDIKLETPPRMVSLVCQVRMAELERAHAERMNEGLFPLKCYSVFQVGFSIGIVLYDSLVGITAVRTGEARLTDYVLFYFVLNTFVMCSLYVMWCALTHEYPTVVVPQMGRPGFVPVRPSWFSWLFGTRDKPKFDPRELEDMPPAELGENRVRRVSTSSLVGVAPQNATAFMNGAAFLFGYCAFITAYVGTIYAMMTVYIAVVEEIVAVLGVFIRWMRSRMRPRRLTPDFHRNTEVTVTRQDGTPITVETQSRVRRYEVGTIQCQTLQASEMIGDVISMTDSFVKSFREQIADLKGEGFDELREPIVAYLLASVSIMRDPSTVTIGIEIAKLVNHTVALNGLRTFKIIEEMNKRLRVVPQTSSSDFVTASIYTDPLAKAAFDILSAVSVVGVCKQLGLVSPSVWYALITLLRTLMPSETPDSFVARIFSFFKLLVERLHLCIKARSFEPLFQAKMTFKQWKDISHTLLYDSSIRMSSHYSFFDEERKKGAIPAFFTRQVTEHERSDLMHSMWNEGEMFTLAGCGGVQHSEVMGAQYEAREMRAKLNTARIVLDGSLAASKQRPVPLGMYLYGPAGTGKSYVLDAFAQMVADDMNVADRAEVRYDMTKTKHMDGVNATKVFLVLDDPDQNRSATPAFGDTTWCQIVIGAINNTPFMAPMADVDSKGNVWLRPRLVVMTTNTVPSAERVVQLGATPSAVFRRFSYYVKLQIADPLECTATGTLVEGTVVRDNTWLHEIYRINPKVQVDNVSDKRPLLVRVKKFDSRIAFLQWVSMQYQEYQYRATKAHAAMLRVDEDARCDNCGLRSSWHLGDAFGPKCVALKTFGPSPPPAVRSDVAARPPGTEPEEDTSPQPEEDAGEPIEVVPQAGNVDPVPADLDAPRPPVEDPLEEATIDPVAGPLAIAKSALFFWCLGLGWQCWNCYFGLVAFQLMFISVGLALSLNPGAAEKAVALGLGGPRMLLAILLFRGVGERLRGRYSGPIMANLARLEGLRQSAGWMKWLLAAFSVMVPLLWMYIRRMRKCIEYQNAFVPAGTQPKKIRVEPSNGFVKLPKLVTAYPAKGTEGMSGADFMKFINANGAVITDSAGNLSHALHLGSGKWLVNKHAVCFSPTPSLETRSEPIGVMKDFITFEHMGTRTSVRLTTRNTSYSVLRDLAVVCAPSVVCRGQGIMKFVPWSSMRSVGRFREITLIIPDDQPLPEAFKASAPQYTTLIPSRSDIGQTSSPVLEYKIATQAGYCGCPLIVKSLSNDFLIVAIHAWGVTNGEVGGFGEEILGSELTELMDLTSAVSAPGEYQMLVMSGACDDPKKHGLMSEVELKDVPTEKSAAIQAWRIGRNFQLLGTLLKSSGQTMKSKFLPTPMKKTITEIAASEGVELNVVAPTFSGEMGEIEVDGEKHMVWKSAFTQSLLGMRNVDGPEEPLDWALNDYLRTVRPGAQGLLKGVQPLDWESVFRGDPDRLFNPKDLDTSTGPPFNTQKRAHIEFHEEETLVRDIYLAEAFDLEQLMRDNPDVVVTPVLKATLKDEPISFEKQREHKERVFYCCNDSFNSLIKRFAGPIVARLSKLDESEMSIGMNIAGIELDIERETRQRYDPLRTREMAADFRWYDKRESNQILRYANEVINELAHDTAYSAADKSILRRLLFGLLYAVVVMKGDVLVFGFSLFSGIWLTAIVNSLVNSILQRAAFYLGNTELVKTTLCRFRDYVYLKVLGDDNNSSVKEGCNFDHFVLRDGVAQYGMELTSAEKNKPLERYAVAEEASYLKRTFYFDEAARRWKAPLAKGSIFKMMCYYRPPKFGMLEDQIATNVFNACSELYLHGRETYERVVPQVLNALPEEVRMSPFLRRVSYENFDARFEAGENIWYLEPESAWPTVVPQMMSGPGADQTSGAAETLTMGLTPMETDSTTVVEEPVPAPAAQVAPLVGDMVEEDPIAILKRAVRISNITLSSTNTAGTQVTAFEPIKLLLTNSSIASKTRGFYAWRGTVDVTMQITVPGTAFGLYYTTLEVHPSGGDGIIDSFSCSYAQAFQCKHSAWVVIEQGGTVRLTVPWVYHWDRAPVLTTDDAFPEIYMRLWCVNPLRSGLDSAAAVSGTIAVYASFGADFRMYAIIPQAGKMSAMLKGGAAVAGALSTVPVLAPYTIPISAGLASLSAVASALGHTRKLEMKATNVGVVASHQPIGPSDGFDSSIPNALTSQSITSDDPRIGGGSDGEDEMSFAYIFSRPGLVGSFTWASSSATGQVLASIPVTPGMVFMGADTSVWYPTPSAFVAAPCAFWRGSMKYHLKVNHPPLSSGVYVLFWSPTQQSGVLSYDPTVSSQACVVDLGPSSERTFVVGWSHFRNVLEMKLGHITSTFTASQCNGYFNIAVVTPLATAALNAPNVSITVTQTCGSDMAIGGARPFRNRIGTLSYTEESLVVAQTTLAPDPISESECVLTTNGEVAADVVRLHYGEPILSVKALLQKFCFTNSFSTLGAAVDPYYRIMISQPCYPIPLCWTSGTVWNSTTYRYTSFDKGTLAFTQSAAAPCFTWFGYLRGAYVGVRGGTLVKIPFVRYNEGSASKRTHPTWVTVSGFEGDMRQSYGGQTTRNVAAPLIGQTWGPLVHMQADVHMTAEFYIPYSSSRLYWPACGRPDNTSAVDRLMAISMYVENMDIVNEIWTAGSSDIALLHWRFAPAIRAPAGGGTLLLLAEPPGEHPDVKNEIVPSIEEKDDGEYFEDGDPETL